MSRPLKPRPPGSIFEAIELALVEISQKKGVPDGTEEVARFLGKTKWTVRHETDPDDAKHTMSARTLSQVAVHFEVEAFAHFFASAAKGVFLPITPAGPEPRWAELSAKSIQEMAAHMTDLVDDLANDGQLDSSEARRELVRLGEILRMISQLYSITLARAEGRA